MSPPTMDRAWPRTGRADAARTVEIDLVSHEGGNAVGEHAYTLTVTDIATGWTENRSVPNKARKWVLASAPEDKTIMEDVLAELNPAAIQRQVQALTARAAHPDHQQGRRRRETGCSGPGSARIRS
jgi:hypothetical protein